MVLRKYLYGKKYIIYIYIYIHTHMHILAEVGQASNIDFDMSYNGKKVYKIS